MEDHKQKADKIYNINKINNANFYGETVINYANKKIPKHLGTIPTFPELFIGRENEVEAVHQRLINQQNILLLVNGQGGIGKTTLASKYYYQYQDYYQHLVWVFSGTSIVDALLTLALPLGVEFPPKMPNEERFTVLLKEMAELNKPCLLIMDNANEITDIEKYHGALLQCTNFHILLTTRVNTKIHNTEIYEVKPLTPEAALQLFTKHYKTHDTNENDLFFAIYESVNRNTLVVELLAKNLANFNNELEQEYSLSRLLENINDSLLKLDKSKAVGTFYHAKNGIQRKETPENIIAAMYDLSRLDEVEKRLLSIFSVLPAESIPYATLKDLVSQERLDKHLFGLFEKGWLDYDGNGKSFRMSPVVQEVVRLKSEDLYGDCEVVIKVLISKLGYKGKHLTEITYELAIELSRYSENIIRYLDNLEKHEIASLSRFIGNYYSIIGNMNKSRFYLNISQNIFSKLTKDNFDNKKFKDGLANSYEGLGTLFSNLGDLSLALKYFTKYNLISNELYNNNLNDKNCKNNLAISHERLGSINLDLGNMEVAFNHYNTYCQLEEELCYTYPNNLDIKNNLAISYERMGFAYTDSGNLAQALHFFEKYSQFLIAISTEFPNDITYINNLAGSYEKLGSTHSKLGNLKVALDFFLKSNVLKQKIYKKNSNNIELKMSFAISYHNLGNTYISLGKLIEAKESFESLNKLFKDLNTNSPNNVEFKNGLSVSYQNLGSVYSSLGDFKIALNFFRLNSILGEELHENSPDNVNFKNNLAISYQFLGITYTNLNNFQMALVYFKKYRQLESELNQNHPDNLNFKENLAISCEKIGSLYSTVGKWSKALELFEEYHVLKKELRNRDSENFSYKHGLAVSHSKLGESYAALERLEEALYHFKIYNELIKELYGNYEKVKLKNDLAVSYCQLGWFYTKKRTNFEEAKKNYLLSKKLFMELINDFPTHIQFRNNLNWVESALKNLS